MTISSELEKLISLRDRGDLSEEEFEKAKELALSGETPGDSPAGEEPPALPASRKKAIGTPLLSAILLTVVVALGGGSLVLNPSPLTGLIFVIWVVAAVLAWVSLARAEKGQE